MSGQKCLPEIGPNKLWPDVALDCEAVKVKT